MMFAHTTVEAPKYGARSRAAEISVASAAAPEVSTTTPSLREPTRASTAAEFACLQTSERNADLLCVHQPVYPWRPLGELLVDAGLLGADELEAALAEQQRSGRRLGEILVARGAISGPQLTRVLAEQCGLDVKLSEAPEPRTPEPGDGEPQPWRPLGSLLVERGALSEAQLSEALREQRTNGRRLGEILVERGYVTTLDLVAAVIDQHGLERSTEASDFTSASFSSRARELYEVEAEKRPGRADVVFRTGGFLDATDFAFELLAAENPSWLRIFRLRGGEREEVWAYDEDRAAEAAASPDVVQLYGFNPARWTGPPTHPAA